MSQEQKALLLWGLLICAAKDRRTYRYSDIAEIMGGHWRHVGRWLDPIYRLCQQRDWPALTILVVNKATGAPGHGLGLDGSVPQERERVFGFNWFEQEPPNIGDFLAAMGKPQAPGTAPPKPPNGDVPGSAPRAHKGRLFGEQEGACAGCGMSYHFRILEVDHIMPRARGGTDDVANLQLLCPPCNREKGTKTMEEWQDGTRRASQAS